jgi:hypothetical protein
MEDLSAFSARRRLAALPLYLITSPRLCTRQGWKVMYPLREVLFLVVCGESAPRHHAPLRQSLHSPRSILSELGPSTAPSFCRLNNAGQPKPPRQGSGALALTGAGPVVDATVMALASASAAATARPSW